MYADLELLYCMVHSFLPALTVCLYLILYKVVVKVIIMKLSCSLRKWFRGGKHLKRNIPHFTTSRRGISRAVRTVNFSNLVAIPTNHSGVDKFCHHGRNNVSNLIPVPKAKPSVYLEVHTWNARSISNKTVTLLDHVIEHDVDIMFINETWLAENDPVVIGECTPPGYDFINHPRGNNDEHGGIGVLFKKSLNLTVFPTGFETSTFEHIRVADKTKSVQFVAVYRPTPSATNGLLTSQFLTEFEQFLDYICTTPGQLVILGDFNVHVDNPNKWDSKRFISTLSTYGFYQHIHGSTHKHGHTLDLVITRLDDNIVQNCLVHPMWYSDHHIIMCSVRYAKPPPMKVVKTSRDFRSLDVDKLNTLLNDRLRTVPVDCDDPSTLCDYYESITSSVLDELCPVVTKEHIIRTRLPWYNSKIHHERRVRRRLERRWRKSRSEDDYNSLIVQKCKLRKLIVDAKCAYYNDKFLCSSTKDMFMTLKSLLNSSSKALPSANCDSDLANDFLSFFVDKVEKIRNNMTLSDHAFQADRDCKSYMPGFKALSDFEVAEMIGQMSNKTCILDTFPSWLIKQNLQCLLPIITRIVNSSLLSGIFPHTLKHSVIIPVLKKVSLDRGELKSYRPVANIKFIAKLIEKAASRQVIQHVGDHDLGEPFQSAYKTHHSTETALLQVRNYILQALDANKAVLLVLLDLSAAFDTIDHDILINRLKTSFGINGSTLAWFRSYLTDRSTQVMVNNEMSRWHILNYSVPQGSIVGPQGFIMYTHPVGDIIRNHDVNFHSYADDTQLFCEFDPKIPGDCERALRKLSCCISDINTWMSQNMLQMNQEKTEFIVFATPCVLKNLPPIQLDVGNTSVLASACVKNLGVMFDSTMSMSNQIGAICKSVNYHIRNLWRIRKFITFDACNHAVRSLVLSRIDYANSLLYGANETDLKRLQRLQNKAARLVFACGRDQSSSQLLTTLHWLPVKERIRFKILLYVYKSLHGEAPSYLTDCLNLYNVSDSFSDGTRRRLRSSSDVTRLVIPRTRRRFGDRSFSTIGPRLWNELPANIREAPSTRVFKRLLKTHLFPVI